MFKKKVSAVTDLSLEVSQGEVFGLIGPNGAGKSTTIRMLFGIISPDSGTIKIQGGDISDISLKKKIGYLPENPYLYDHLTLLELLDFCGRSSGLDARAIRSSSQNLIEKLNLGEAQNRPLRTFSKGMLQRAGICFALLHDPSIVILDEPMSGLDPIGRKMVFNLVMELKAKQKTVFFCSHILNDVERLCDRIGLLNKGRLVKEINQRELIEYDQFIFLNIAQPENDQIIFLSSLGCSLRKSLNGTVLAVPFAQTQCVHEYLSSQNIDLLGSQAEWLSLEEIFAQTIQEVKV